MPKTTKKMYKKRTSRKSTGWVTRYKPRDTVIYRPDVGLGRSVATRLKTCIFANISFASGTPSIYNLLPGSAFNPMGDLTSIQPASFDQWKVLFARYLVTGATVSIEPVFSATAAHIGEICCLCTGYPSTVVGPIAASATFQGYASQPWAQSRNVNQGVVTKPMFWKMSTQKIVGSRLPPVAEDCGALISASPGTGQNMVLPLFTQTNVVSTSTLTYRITIIQDVIFDQRIQVVDA